MSSVPGIWSLPSNNNATSHTSSGQPVTPQRRESTPTHGADRTHPITPESPTLYMRRNRRALRREPAMILARSILHYDRLTKNLQTWYWYADSGYRHYQKTDNSLNE